MNEFNRLTIVISDKAVYKDSTGYSDLDFSNCGIPDDVWAFQWENGEGWIEFKDSRENEPFVGTDFPEWINKCIEKFDVFHELYTNPPPPTPEQIAEDNRFHAKIYIEDSDWAALPDTHLQNQAEWDVYRAALRMIVINPPQEEIPEDSWPVKPKVVWA